MCDDTATLLPRSRRVVAESRRGLGIIVTQCFFDGERNDRETRGRFLEKLGEIFGELGIMERGIRVDLETWNRRCLS